ncbi:hypothetical protein ABZP36_035108 [Zizania latifolia]
MLDDGADELVGPQAQQSALSTIGALWTTAVAYGRRKSPQMRLIHALAVLGVGGAALAHRQLDTTGNLDYDFYSLSCRRPRPTRRRRSGAGSHLAFTNRIMMLMTTMTIN